MKIWDGNKKVDLEIGQSAVVCKNIGGCARTLIVGECAVLRDVSDKKLTFITQSGKKVSTRPDDLANVIGKLGKAGWTVTTGDICFKPSPVM